MAAYGVLLIVVGLALVVLAVRLWRTRPGWAGFYGRAALVALVGAFVVVGGVLDIALA